MSQDELPESTPPSTPSRESAEDRLNLRHPHLANTRYRLLNLRECVKRNDADEAPTAE